MAVNANTAGFSLRHLASGFVTCPCVKVLSLNFTTTPCSSNLIELAHYNRPFQWCMYKYI